MTRDTDYVLGTHDAEIERLGLQHRVWRPHATRAWQRAGFTTGQRLLDVGAGPGYAALDLAEIVGPAGRVIAVERSERFLAALEAAARQRGLAHLEAHALDLDEAPLPATELDGAWARWVFAFVRHPRPLLARVVGALRPGGTLAVHEYADYGAWRLAPRSEVFERFVDAVMRSWRDAGGEPDIALELPCWLTELDCELLEVSPIAQVARPGSFLWEWPRRFVEVGLERLIALGHVDRARAAAVHEALAVAEATPGACMIQPTVLEVIARKR